MKGPGEKYIKNQHFSQTLPFYRIRKTDNSFEMIRNQAEQISQKFISYLETGVTPEGLFSKDIFLDFTLPCWRIQARGVDEVLEVRRKGHPFPGKVPRWRCDPIENGFYLEIEETWNDNNQQKFYCRELIRCEVNPNHEINNLSVYCTGDWDLETQKAHQQHVKLIRP
jgi:hypothetical protein